MGVEPFLVASSVNLIMAQRLVRVICANCREPAEIPPPALIEIGIPEADIGTFQPFHGVGCPDCGNSGYRGRISLFEVMTCYEEIRELILAGASSAEIKRTAVSLGMQTMRQAGISKLRNGITTIEEVVRVTMPD